MSQSNSKPLAHDDTSGFEFAKEMLAGDQTFAINFDRIQHHPDMGYIIFEYLLCEESQHVTPYSSHPNRYFHKNAQKFISLYQIACDLPARLFLVNYAKKNTAHDNEILLMEVTHVDPKNTTNPVSTKNFQLTRQEFSDRFRKLNMACKLKHNS